MNLPLKHVLSRKASGNEHFSPIGSRLIIYPSAFLVDLGSSPLLKQALPNAYYAAALSAITGRQKSLSDGISISI